MEALETALQREPLVAMLNIAEAKRIQKKWPVFQRPLQAVLPAAREQDYKDRLIRS